MYPSSIAGLLRVRQRESAADFSRSRISRFPMASLDCSPNFRMRWPRFLRRYNVRSIVRGGLTYLFGKRGQRRVKGLQLFYGLRLLMLLRTSRQLGMLARGHEVRLWVDGEEAFSRLEQLIRRARMSIVVQMFIWKDDATGRRMAEALLEAADRGVQVDITKEAVGDFFEYEYRGDFLSTQRSNHPCWKRFWKHRRIRITYSTNQDHAKVFVFDDATLVLTGMNIADEYRYRWHDYMVELRGKRYVEQFLTRGSPSVSDPVQLIMNTEDTSGIRPAVMRLIDSARESLFIEQIFLSDSETIDALIRASKRHVRVTIILPERTDLHHYANMHAVGRLLTEGDGAFVRIFLYRGINHGKVMLIDRRTACVGSANLIKSSLDEMGEVNVVFSGKHRAIWKLQDTLRQDVLRSRSLSSPPSFLWLSKWLSWLGL